MKIIMTFVLSLMLSTAIMATESSNEQTVFVKGMVCAFCAQGIEKSFMKEPEIEKISVRLEEHKVTLTYKEGQKMESAKIASLLEASGYSVDETRTN
jgi:periplasmic mercuric ion binding protein